VAAPPAAKAAVAKKPVRTGKAARTTLLDLNEKICKWPIGHPGDADFHFCGKPVQAGFPYCTEHCLVAYQAQLPRRDRDRRPPPQMPGMPRR
jgi:GcrA cell cycle regulator